MSSGPNPLYIWLKKNKWWGVKNGDSTHYFFDGGKASIPDDMNGTFNNYLFHSLQKCPQFVIEQKTPVYKYFIDLDFRAEVDTSQTQTHLIINLIKREVDIFYAGTYEVIVCTRPRVEIKAGMHLIWPGVFTDSEDALALRQILVETCESEIGKVFCNTWPEIIDKTVYKKNGLQMIGCRKSEGDTTVYTPTWKVNAGGEWTVISGGVSKDTIRSTSIRYFGHNKTPTNKPATNTSGGSSGEDTNQKVVGHKGQLHEKVNMETIRWELDVIKDQIVKNLDSNYATLRFVEAKKLDRQCFSLKTDSRFCTNKGACHCSSTVYFVVNKDSIVQHCFSNNHPDGATKPCKQYKSKPIALPESVRKSSTFFDYVDEEVARQARAILASMLP